MCTRFWLIETSKIVLVIYKPVYSYYSKHTDELYSLNKKTKLFGWSIIKYKPCYSQCYVEKEPVGVLKVALDYQGKPNILIRWFT
jgi:hypothetical protein